MAARCSNTYFTLKVCLLYLYFGSSRSQSTTSSTVVSESISTQPSPNVSAIAGNASIIHSATTSAATSSGNLNASATSPSGSLGLTVIPSSSTVTASQSSSIQNNLMPPVPSEDDIEQEFGPLVAELGQIISKEIDPMNDKPSDVKVLKTLVPMLKKGVAFLAKYNHTEDATNPTVDFLNITDSFVIVMKKFDCLKDMEAVIPDRSKKSTRKDLGKVTDYVALKFDCPRIVINDTQPPKSKRRKRRDVQLEVTMEISADADNGDFHEFQLLHHRSRHRRSAAAPQQCRPLKCNVKRFEATLIITSRNFEINLEDKSSSEYQNLTHQLTAALQKELAPSVIVDNIHNFIYYTSEGSNVKASFYLDVYGPAFTEDNITEFLKTAAPKDTLKPFKVRTTAITSEHRNVDCVHDKKGGGNITSPLFPKDYPTGVRCVWVLTAPANHTVKLTLKEFHLEKDKKCFYDYMEFFNGNTTTDEQRQNGNRICGTRYENYTIESTGDTLTVVFNSDKSVTYKGFRAEWETKDKVIKYVPQYVTALTTIYSPNVNGTHYPLGTATACTAAKSTTLDQECIFKEKVFVISRLISTHIDHSRSPDGANRIVINFEHVMNDQLFPAMYKGQKYCVTWNDKAKLEKNRGAWTRKGCSVLTTNITHTSCACDRQGIFAVLGQEKIDSGKLKLLANTYIGIGIAYFILILAIVHIVWKMPYIHYCLRSVHNWVDRSHLWIKINLIVVFNVPSVSVFLNSEIHGGEVMRINMCAAIIVMQSVFLIGAHVKAQQTLCGFLSFAIYFSVLAEFCWLLLHGLRIHGKIKKIFASNLNIEIVYVVIGWGLPLLLALIAIGVKIDPKSPNEVCWQAAAGGAMWGYAGPVILIALLNAAVLIKLLIPTQDVKDGYDYKEMRFRVLKDFVFLLCFGLTCTFAYHAVEEERYLEQYLLSAFVIMQALAMFVFGREGRKDFIKRDQQANPDPEPEAEPAYEEPGEENVYENIELETKPKERDLGDRPVKRHRKRASNKQPEKITVSTLKNLNIYKEGGHYVIEA